jgi:hypothetical protein
MRLSFSTGWIGYVIDDHSAINRMRNVRLGRDILGQIGNGQTAIRDIDTI